MEGVAWAGRAGSYLDLPRSRRALAEGTLCWPLPSPAHWTLNED